METLGAGCRQVTALSISSGRTPARGAAGVLWLAIAVFAAVCFGLRGHLPWLVNYPADWTWPIAVWINAAMDWFVASFRGAFRAASWLLSWPMQWIRDLLQWLPWSASLAGITVLAYAAAGWRLALFTAASLLYIVVVGYWSESMNTLALVFVAVPLALALGFAMGVCSYRSETINRIVQPTLDVMQTVPTFAYLIPILLLFGFGPVVGLIASAIYACPPMVRNVILGLQRVPPDVVESGRMSGATRHQLFWWVQVPSALPTIMIGVNQTTMAALSMVIIAAIIGSSADIGWEVLSTMRKAQFGQSLLAGAVIALIAMIMDRISRGFAEQQRRRSEHTGPGSHDPSALVRHRILTLAVVTMTTLSLLSCLVPPLGDYPRAWVYYPAGSINDALTYVTANYPHVTDALKKSVLFYFLLPIRIGLESAVRPFSWGFELTSGMVWGYAISVAALTAFAYARWGRAPAIIAAVLGGILYFGVSNIPWPVFVLIITTAAWQAGGWRVGIFALCGLFFMLLGGVWPQAMLSVYLCGAAVLVSFGLGTTLGVLAAGSDRVSVFLRPINDTFQTMPLFVFLIPVLMFFQVGDFAAFLAIIAYATVPAIRYTEHGLRSVPHEVIEAARSMGCTRRQILWQVKLPLAAPEIMLGLNQTIMFALAMLVIAALVGTKGLGQAVYIALSSADTGKGLVAGFSMALIAMITDRIIQAWSKRRKAALGL